MTSIVLSHSIGATPEFIQESEQIANKITFEYGVPVLRFEFSPVRHRGRLGDYSKWQNKARVFNIHGREHHELFTTVLHETAHHISTHKIQEARQNKDYELAQDMATGGRSHGKGFKQILKDLEHRFYPYGHSAWGSAGCRNSSRASRKDWLQRNSVCKESDMAKLAAKKNEATAPDIFKVTVNIEEPFKRPAGGIIIAPHEFTVYAEAKSDLAAQGKVLRAYGLSDRDNAKFTVKVEHVKAPSKIKKAPVYVIQKAS